MPTCDWFDKAAVAIVREGSNLFKWANENNKGLTKQDCDAIAKSPEFQASLRAARNKFYKELASDPSRSRNAALGRIIYAVDQLLEAGQYEKAVAALTQLMKAEGWLTEGASVNIFQDISGKDIETLRKKMGKEPQATPKSN